MSVPAATLNRPMDVLNSSKVPAGDGWQVLLGRGTGISLENVSRSSILADSLKIRAFQTPAKRWVREKRS